MLGSQPYTLWSMSSFLSPFRINTSCAPVELSYSTATVLPPWAAPGQLEGAGRAWKLPQHWPQDCWPQDSRGLSQISATMDQPLRIHPVPAPGPASAHPCPGTGAAGTAAMECTGCNTCSLSCATCMNLPRAAAAPSLGWGTHAPHSAHSQATQDHSACSEPA